MLTISLSFIPEFIIILTSGTVKISTKPAPKIVLNESTKAFEISVKLILCKIKVTRQTIISIPPGKYKTWKLALIFSSSSILIKLKLTDLRKFVKGSYVLEIISIKAKKIYGNQALILLIFFSDLIRK